MKDRPKIDLGMTGYDELFMNDAARAENRLPKIYDIPLSEIDDFPDHPFKVRDDEDMMQLVESVKERGVITPITLRRKDDDRYEIVSGHRRKRACELAGLKTIPAEIKPSEKAYSYKMRLEAMKRQGQRTDLTSGPLGQKSNPVDSRQELADSTLDSARQVSRYIRLTELEPELLDMVDEGRIALRPAVELSYLDKGEQQELVDAIEASVATPSHAQAIKMRNFSKEGKLTPEVFESIMCEEKPNQKEKVSIRYEDARKFIPPSVPYDKTGEYILKALEYYHRHLERQRDEAR